MKTDVWKWIASLLAGLVVGGGAAGTIGNHQYQELRNEMRVEIGEASDDRDMLIATLTSKVDLMYREIGATRESLIELRTVIEERVPRPTR